MGSNGDSISELPEFSGKTLKKQEESKVFLCTRLNCEIRRLFSTSRLMELRWEEAIASIVINTARLFRGKLAIT